MDNGCFNCKYFAWWDGDYCCLSDWSILIPSEYGELDLSIRDKMVERALSCKDYIYSDKVCNIYKNIFHEAGSKEEEG